MQYLMIISHDDEFTPTESLFGEIAVWIIEMERLGIRVYGNPLQPANTAKTVRIRKDKLKVSRGPFENSNEKMCAYELLDCGSMEEAIEVAAKHPMAKVATIEIRPVWTELAHS